MVANDGERTQLNVVDNDASSSRFRIGADAQPLDELAVGGLFEADFRVNPSGSVTNDGDIANPNGAFRTRKIEATFSGPSWGKVSLGKGDMASNSITEIDLSGTDFTGTYSSVTDMAGGYEFVDKDTGDLSGIAIGDAAGNIDGLSRHPRVRYDTPAFYGLTVSASYGQESRYDAAVRYANEYGVAGGVKVAAGIAYFAQPRAKAFNKGQGDRPDSRADTQGVAGSVSALHSSGFNFTFASGTENDKLRSGEDPFYFYLKPGYRTSEWVPLGETAFSVDYGRFSDFANGTDNGRMNTVGFSTVQHIEPAATELYISGRWHSYDQDDEDFKDVFALLTGARVKF
jgi:predicted porin